MKLPNWMCNVIGHKCFALTLPQYRKTGAVSVCVRCGKGYVGDRKGNPWVEGILDNIRE